MTKAQVVVLGAGMVGTGAALALQARGFQVALLDRAGPGGETSYGNAGVIQGEACEPFALPRDVPTLFRIAFGIDNAVTWDWPGLWHAAPSLLAYWRNSAPDRYRQIATAYAALISRATHDHAGWIDASGSESLIRREGYRLVFRDQPLFESQAQKAERYRVRYGTRFEREDGAALEAAEPALRRRLAGAIRWHDAWTCRDPGALVGSYAKVFVARGGELVRAECRGLQQVGGGWRVTTNKGSLEAEHAVVALGHWSPEVLSPLGYRVPLVRKRGYHMHFEYPRTSRGSAPHLNLTLIDADFSAVYAPMTAGLRILTGADLSRRISEGVPRQLKRAQMAARELLDIGEPLERDAWSGVRPCMPDMLPLVGSAPRHRGLWFNFGHGHQGFTLGPTTGKLLAGLIDGEPDTVTEQLAPSRLALS